MGVNQMLALGYLAHFVFLVVSYGKESFLQLPVIYLRQEISLILYRVRTGT